MVGLSTSYALYARKKAQSAREFHWGLLVVSRTLRRFAPGVASHPPTTDRDPRDQIVVML
jgi:hypothetical protein